MPDPGLTVMTAWFLSWNTNRLRKHVDQAPGSCLSRMACSAWLYARTELHVCSQHSFDSSVPLVAAFFILIQSTKSIAEQRTADPSYGPRLVPHSDPSQGYLKLTVLIVVFTVQPFLAIRKDMHRIDWVGGEDVVGEVVAFELTRRGVVVVKVVELF